VVDLLRLFWHRPLRDGDRPRLFAIAVALIAGAAAMLTQLERPGGPAVVPKPRPAPPASVPAATAAPTLAPSEPAAEGARTTARPAHVDVTASKRAARRFLAGYLPYSYGRRGTRRIDAASPALRRRLAAERPRVPDTERARAPRLVLIQSDAVGPRSAGLVALVDDGRRRYTVALELTRTGGRWQVDHVGD
jgi:hypothetical protein